MDWAGYLASPLGATGLLSLTVVLVLRGKLVPRSTLEMMRADRDREVETWKAIAERRSQLIDVQQHQIAMLLEGNRTTQRVIEALPEAARLSREGGSGALAQAPEG